jgi:hypothetical protein
MRETSRREEAGRTKGVSVPPYPPPADTPYEADRSHLLSAQTLRARSKAHSVPRNGGYSSRIDHHPAPVEGGFGSV